MSEGLKLFLCEILNERHDSRKIEKFLQHLGQIGVKEIADLQYLNKESLEKFEILSGNEIELLIARFLGKNLKDVLAKIFAGTKDDRIEIILKHLQENGASDHSDLKYLDWDSLERIGILTEMEIKKFMRYVAANFPDEYSEHKKMYDEKQRIKRKTELLNMEIQAAENLEIEKRCFDSNLRRRNYDGDYAQITIAKKSSDEKEQNNFFSMLSYIEPNSKEGLEMLYIAATYIAITTKNRVIATIALAYAGHRILHFVKLINSNNCVICRISRFVLALTFDVLRDLKRNGSSV